VAVVPGEQGTRSGRCRSDARQHRGSVLGQLVLRAVPLGLRIEGAAGAAILIDRLEQVVVPVWIEVVITTTSLRPAMTVAYPPGAGATRGRRPL
jgi:hypothetical protein